MTELVQLTTQDVSRGIPVTTSEIVASEYKVKHHAVQQLLNKYESDFNELGKLTFQMRPLASGQAEKIYQLTEEHFFLLVTFMKNTEIARRAKVQFVRAFSFMKKELLARTDTRKIGKIARLSITDAINKHISSDGNFKKYAYGNYSKLVYKRVLGIDVKHAKEQRGVPDGGNLRNFLTIEELDKVQDLESKIAAFIEVSDTEGKDDKQIYQMVKAWIDSRSNQ